MLAGQDLLVILAIALIVFGPKKLPELMKTIGRTLGEVKKATEDLKESIGIKELEEIRSNLTMDLYSAAEKLSASMLDKKAVEQGPASADDSVPAEAVFLPKDRTLALEGEGVDKDNNEKSVGLKEEKSFTS